MTAGRGKAEEMRALQQRATQVSGCHLAGCRTLPSVVGHYKTAADALNP